MKRLILMRHAESEKNKAKELREITLAGRKKCIRVSENLDEILKGDVKVVYTSSRRVVQTAEIVCKILNPKERGLFESRLENLDNISQFIDANREKGVEPAESILNFPWLQQYKVENFQHLVDRITTFAKVCEQDNLILIGHGGSLEPFLVNQNVFAVEIKTFDSVFDYSDFAILKDKLLK